MPVQKYLPTTIPLVPLHGNVQSPRTLRVSEAKPLTDQEGEFCSIGYTCHALKAKASFAVLASEELYSFILERGR